MNLCGRNESVNLPPRRGGVPTSRGKKLGSRPGSGFFSSGIKRGDGKSGEPPGRRFTQHPHPRFLINILLRKWSGPLSVFFRLSNLVNSSLGLLAREGKKEGGRKKEDGDCKNGVDCLLFPRRTLSLQCCYATAQS